MEVKIFLYKCNRCSELTFAGQGNGKYKCITLTKLRKSNLEQVQ